MRAEDLWKLLVSAARRTVRERGAFGLTVLTLGLGLGANGAVYSVLTRAFEAPLAVAAPDSLVTPHNVWPSGLFNQFTFSQFESIRRTQVFRDLAASGVLRLPVTLPGGARGVRVCFVSDRFFSLLAPAVSKGRLIAPADAQFSNPVAVLTHGLWREEFGGRNDIVGTSLKVNGRPFAIVGVVAPGFVGTNIAEPAEVFLPWRAASLVRARPTNYFDEPGEPPGYSWLSVVGRLGNGQAINDAEHSLNVRLKGFGWTENRGREDRSTPALRLISAQTAAIPVGVRAEAESFGVTITCLALLILFAAVVGVANLQLAGNIKRTSEFAIRRALGASRQRLFLQVSAENVIVCGVAWALSIPSSAMIAELLAHFHLPGGIAITAGRPFGWLPISAMGVLSVVIGVATSAASFLVSPRHVGEGLSLLARRVSATRCLVQPADILVVAQLALSCVLLGSSLLFQSSIREGLSSALGFKTDGVLVVTFPERIEEKAKTAGPRQAATRIAALPEVRSQSLCTNYFGVGGRALNSLTLDGREVVTSPVSVNFVAPHYFDVLGIEFVAGRRITAEDAPGSPQVAVINESLAHVLGVTRTRLGQRVGLGRKLGDVVIVGIARNAKYFNLGEHGQLCAYLSLAQHAAQSDPRTLLVRVDNTSAGRAALSIRQAVASLDPDIPMEVRSMASVVRAELEPQALGEALAGLFGVIAALLSAVSIYSLVSLRMADRVGEIAVRVALGASPRRIAALAFRMVAKFLLFGEAAGLLLTVAAAQTLRTRVPGLPSSNVGLCAVVLTVGALAVALGVLVPTFRASRLEPMPVLRAE